MVWYTSTPLPQAQKIASAFEKEYGIKVELFRSGGSAVLRRFQQEIDAGRIAADVLTTSDPAAAAVLARKGVFVAFKPKNFDKVPDAAKDKDGHYVAQRLNLMTIYLRTDKVPAADEPKTWNDLADPKYKGKLVIDRPVVHLAAGLGGRHDVEGARLGLLREAARQRHHGGAGQPAGRRHAQARRAADRGRRARLLCGGGPRAGHPMKTLYPSDGVFVIPSPTVGGEGQPQSERGEAVRRVQTSATRCRRSFRRTAGLRRGATLRRRAGSPPLSSLKILTVDYDYIEKETPRIKRRFNEVFQ